MSPPARRSRLLRAAPAKPPVDDGFDQLLAVLQVQRGIDFAGYKRPSLQRRVQKRMQEVRCRSFAEYASFLTSHPGEYLQLLNTVLINVTGFFRDPSTWQYLAEHILPALIERRAEPDAVRVWSAGCSSGQEAYSVAILLAERVGLEAFGRRVKIYATDVDDEALTEARLATYTAREVASVPPAMLARYFEASGNRYTVVKELRRGVIFGRHDLLQDAPISRVDLLLWRNTLMYFAAEAQAKILERLHFALTDGGVLFMGKAEMLLTHGRLFAPIDLKRRLFTPVNRGTRERLANLVSGTLPADEPPPPRAVRVAETVFDVSPVAQLIVDASAVLVLANERARHLFKLTGRDMGKRLQDLPISYRPVELRSRIEEAYVSRRPVEVREVEWQPDGGEPICADVQITPRFDPSGPVGVVVSFHDVTRSRDLQQELRRAARELEGAYEELQSTSEELETTNEELQSTNEELETTNEELQSTNEELETMNEELQSTNEELQTMNNELRDRGEQLNRSNLLFLAVLGCIPGAVVVVDTELRVLVWNSMAQDMWGLRGDEVQGKHLLNLELGIQLERVKGHLKDALAGKQVPPVTTGALDRRGRRIECRVSFAPLGSSEGTWGLIVFMEDVARVRASLALPDAPKALKAPPEPKPPKQLKGRAARTPPG